MVFKMRYTKSYGHVHCTLFVSQGPTMTFANCGEIIVRKDEFEKMQIVMPGVAFEEKEDISDTNKGDQSHMIEVCGDDPHGV